MQFNVSANLKDSEVQKYYKERFDLRGDNFSAWVQQKMLEDRDKEEDPDFLSNLISQRESELEALKKKHLKSIEKRIAKDQIESSHLKSSNNKKQLLEKRLYGYTISMGIYLPKISADDAEVLAIEYDKIMQSNPELTIRDFLISKGYVLKPLKNCVPAAVPAISISIKPNQKGIEA